MARADKQISSTAAGEELIGSSRDLSILVHESLSPLVSLGSEIYYFKFKTLFFRIVTFRFKSLELLDKSS